jgi:hypothetical protein
MLVVGRKAHIYHGNPGMPWKHSSGDCSARFVDISEKYSVRCCSKTWLKGFVGKRCKSTYGASSIEGRCHKLANWEEAKKVRSDAGARLCAFEESKCAIKTGCGLDTRMLLSSNEEDASTTGMCDEVQLKNQRCLQKHEWSEERLVKLCPNYASKSFRADACKGSYQMRLRFSLGNQLYPSCLSRCVYDYETLVGKGEVRGAFLYHRIKKCFKFVRKGRCFKMRVQYAEAQARAKSIC